jgi:hypothetical protein
MWSSSLVIIVFAYSTAVNCKALLLEIIWLFLTGWSLQKLSEQYMLLYPNGPYNSLNHLQCMPSLEIPEEILQHALKFLSSSTENVHVISQIEQFLPTGFI